MKIIKLTKGYEAIVDDEDFEMLTSLGKWCYSKGGRNTYAIYWENGKRKFMHRIIMNPSSDLFIDHKNGNGLDNRRSNLRLATKSQNGQNSNKTIYNKTSQYKGVSKIPAGWRAYIIYQGKPLHLGCYKNEVTAALHYDAKARELYGEFCRLNFPLTKESSCVRNTITLKDMLTGG